MSKKLGNSAQDGQLNHSDQAIAGMTQGATFTLGTIGQPATTPDGTQMWFGSGNLPTNYNLTENGSLDTGLKIHHRGGADYLPVSGGPNGEQVYNVQSGTQAGSPSRAEWNFDYAATSAPGINSGDVVDLAKASALGDFDLKLQITQTMPQLLGGSTKSVVYDYNPSNHTWVDENNPALGFGGDDFNQPGASPQLQNVLTENSVNLGFSALAAEFGPLSTSNAPGVQYDVTMAGWKGGTSDMLTFVHDHLNVVAPSS